MGAVDFHSHFLPGIDDGSKNREMSRQMLEESARQGIDLMCATPHFYADSQRIDSFLRHRDEAYEKVKPFADELGIDIALGAEVAFFPGMAGAQDIDKLCFEGTNTLLVEMPFRAWTEKDVRELELLLRASIRPVIAHLERFYRFQEKKYVGSKNWPINAVLELPVYVQLNAECLLSFTDRLKYMKLFKDGSAQLLGSDCHNVSSRPQNLAEGRAQIAKNLGDGFLEDMDILARQLAGKQDS